MEYSEIEQFNLIIDETNLYKEESGDVVGYPYVVDQPDNQKEVQDFGEVIGNSYPPEVYAELMDEEDR